MNPKTEVDVDELRDAIQRDADRLTSQVAAAVRRARPAETALGPQIIAAAPVLTAQAATAE